jgi:hypothetical protein
MITSTGKSIIAKYLLGQVPDYASYIAVGCGAQPLDLVDTLGDYSSKENLDFETLRVPIISRGLITENNVSKVVLTAELPTENRYDISEIGVFSAGSNPALGAFSSRFIYQFSGGEGWTYNAATPVLVTQSIADGTGNIDQDIDGVSSGCFYLNSDNAIFDNGSRSEDYERPRNQNSSLLVTGAGSTPIVLTGTSLDLDNFSINDELRLAFSAVSTSVVPVALGRANVTIEFAYSADPNATKATFTAEVSATGGIDKKYFVDSMTLKQIAATATANSVAVPDFSWAAVKVIRIYANAYTTTAGTISTTPTDEFYIMLDGLRIENAQTNNPAYGMIGYTVVKTDQAVTITKNVNNPAYIEFRFALDVN